MLIAPLLLMAFADLQVVVSSAEIQIGEPVVCTVDLSTLEGVRPTLSEEALEPGRGWIVLEEPTLRRDRAGDLVLTWTLMALEPEAGALPRPALMQEESALALEAPAITVASALLEGEDAPRPARGFHVPPPEEVLASSDMWVYALVGTVISALVLWGLRRRRRPQPEAEPSLSERLAYLGGEVQGGEEELVAWHGELTRILRAAYSEDQGGWSDEEWIERAELSKEQRDELRGLFATCAAVKYGGARPTSFAVEETLKRARELVARVEELAA